MSESELTIGEPWQVRATAYLVGATLVVMSVHQFTRGTPFNVALGVVLLIASVGQLKRLRWGRRMAVLFMWLLLVFAIGDILPARIEADEALGRPPATPAQLVTQLILLCSVALGALHFLGRHKARYRPDWW